MAYVEPTPETFKARFPEFSSVSDTLVGLILDEAIAQVGPSWVERDRAPAQMYLAAHMLTLEGEPERSASGASTALTGPVKRIREGDVETEFAGTGNANGKDVSGFSATPYGKAYARLLRANFGGPQIVA